MSVFISQNDISYQYIIFRNSWFFWKNDFFLKIEMLIIMHIQCPKSANEWPIFKNEFYNILEQCLKILFNILIKYIAQIDNKMETLERQNEFFQLWASFLWENFTSKIRHFLKNSFQKSQILNIFTKWRNYMDKLYFMEYVNWMLHFAKLIRM